MRYPVPTIPGYYWAKLRTPSAGRLYGIPGFPEGIVVPASPDDRSVDWEIVEVWDNGGEGEEQFGVSVPGVYATQWIDDFYWGPRVNDRPPQ